MAIKQINGAKHAFETECYEFTVPMEALCMYELRDCPTVCRLRSVRKFDADRSDDRVWRLYQEYCPNGSIRDMLEIYKQYNREHPDDHMRVPEAYIWWL